MTQCKQASQGLRSVAGKRPLGAPSCVVTAAFECRKLKPKNLSALLRDPQKAARAVPATLPSTQRPIQATVPRTPAVHRTRVELRPSLIVETSQVRPLNTSVAVPLITAPKTLPSSMSNWADDTGDLPPPMSGGGGGSSAPAAAAPDGYVL